MEAGELLQLSMSRDVKARGMLSPGTPKPLWDIFGGLVKAIVHQRLLAGLGRSKIVGHGFSSTGRWDMWGAWADDDGRWQRPLPRGRSCPVGRLSSSSIKSVRRATLCSCHARPLALQTEITTTTTTESSSVIRGERFVSDIVEGGGR